MTCKDCLHYKSHKHFFNSPDYDIEFDDYYNAIDIEYKCPEFTNRSEWVHLPCKVGDKVYQTDGIRIYESTIREIEINSAMTVYCTEDTVFDERAIGNSILLTREEAEKHWRRRNEQR